MKGPLALAAEMFATDPRIESVEFFMGDGVSMGRVHRRDVSVTTPTGATCGSCKFFQTNGSNKIGDCHRFPPFNLNHWPIVSDMSWCGEWRPMNRTLAEITEDMIRR